jgi:hypothetical protein
MTGEGTAARLHFRQPFLTKSREVEKKSRCGKQKNQLYAAPQQVT